MKQQTFDDIARVSVIAGLNKNQRRVVALLAEGLTQGTIHDRLKLSRSFISQTVTLLEKQSLLKRKSSSRYNAFYDLSPELKSLISEKPQPQLSACRVHNLRRKYKMAERPKTISCDQRAGFMKSWEMRGGTWYKFWFSGKAGEPSITIDVPPGTIVAYPDKGQTVVAETVAEAEEKTMMVIHQAVRKFIDTQAKFGVHIQVDGFGKQISQTHYGFALEKGSAHAESEPTLEGWIKDASPADLGNPNLVELETRNKMKATAMDEAIKTVTGIDDRLEDGIRRAMPEAMKEFEKTISPLTKEIHTVMAHIQSGQPLQNQVNQLILMFSEVLKQQHDILARLDTNGGTKQGVC